MKLKLLLLVGILLFLVQPIIAETDTYTIRWIVPGDITPPTFNNLRNFTHNVDTSFSQSITASDTSGIDVYFLNDTSTFTIDENTGLITNVSELDLVKVYYLNLSVNDTLGNMVSGIFYINVITPTVSNVTVTNVETCRYKKLGYYNTKLVWIKQSGCV